MKQLNARQLIRELNIRGWSVSRNGPGSHIQFKKPGVDCLITVPFHGARPLPIGLLKRIMKDAGIAESDL